MPRATNQLTINMMPGQTASDNDLDLFSSDGSRSSSDASRSSSDASRSSSNNKGMLKYIKELLSFSLPFSLSKLAIISLVVVFVFIVLYSILDHFDSLPTWLGGSGGGGGGGGSGGASTIINSINFKLNIIPLCEFTEYLSNTNDLINNGVTVYIKKKLSNTDLENIEDTCYSGKEIDNIFIKKTKDNETYVYIRVNKPASTTAGSGEAGGTTGLGEAGTTGAATGAATGPGEAGTGTGTTGAATGPGGAEGSAGTTGTIDSKITQLLTTYSGLSRNTGHSVMCECNDFKNDIGEGEYELIGNFELTNRIKIRKHKYTTSQPNLLQEWYTSLVVPDDTASPKQRVIFTFEISDDEPQIICKI